MFRHRADVRSVLTVLSFPALVAFQWFHGPSAIVPAALLVLLTCMQAFRIAVITHNTVHVPVFHSRALNAAFQILLTLSYGFPVSEFVPGHNLSHHRYTQTARDRMRTSKARFRWHLLNLLFFFAAVGPAITRDNLRYAALMRTRRPRWHRQLVTETILAWTIRLGLVALDWRKGLLLVALPHAFAVWGITTVNLLQHDGCDPDSAVDHSRNFVGRLFNWLTFNNGYHTAHHDQPSLHWSMLPAAHARNVHPFIHPALEQQSLVLYVLRTFIVPGGRVRFDGAPFVLPPPEADRPWFGDAGAEEAASTRSDADDIAAHAA